MRVNYIRGDYEGEGDGPSRGGDGGDIELDNVFLKMALCHERLIGEFQYRWYEGYNFLHTGWLGVESRDGSHSQRLEVGVTRVPFGPSDFGVSKSWFFDQHFYVGLTDDSDLGVKYVQSRGKMGLDVAYFYSSEPDWRGSSRDSARYGYDVVRWRSSIEQDGTVVNSSTNGYRERNQFNVRAIYGHERNLGFSLQYGQLDGKRADDGHHWAASLHSVIKMYGLELASQLTRYEIEVDDDNSLQTDHLVPMGAYDFAWPVATAAWLPGVSLSYKIETTETPWLDSVRPYIEFSNIIKDENDFNDSRLFVVGASWTSGGWLVYSDLAVSDGNFFVGDEGDDYGNIANGVGDFGVNGNDRWNYRLNLNFGYYVLP